MRDREAIDSWGGYDMILERGKAAEKMMRSGRWQASYIIISQRAVHGVEDHEGGVPPAPTEEKGDAVARGHGVGNRGNRGGGEVAAH